ncbi:HNH endonuclease [Bacillus sp. CDB3]|uniref:HNH endonuclease n=1 Tax=Bacillus sp. CDB3 TaxID=360310 RepID=UPI0015C483A5|nr:HNH endonuclease [Bacillus sp. CDB3]
MNEQWKQFGQSAKRKYYISSQGNVKSINTVTGVEHHRKLSLDKDGYHYVLIKKKAYRVNRLVAQAYIPNVYNKPFVNHLNLNRTNNDVSNLEWVTHRENIQHSYKYRKLKQLHN